MIWNHTPTLETSCELADEAQWHDYYLKQSKDWLRPFTDELIKLRLDFLYKVADIYTPGTISTQTFYSKDGEKWDLARAVYQRSIVEELSKSWASLPKGNKEATIMGGVPGSGKTTTLRLTQNLAGRAFISPDEVKEVMGATGGFLKHEGLTPMEASIFGYEEANIITRMLIRKAISMGLDFVVDTTMSSRPNVVKYVTPMLDNGYKVHVLFVESDLDEALARTIQRYKQGLNRYVSEGYGSGGRLLPRHSITSQISVPGSQFISRSRELLEEMWCEGSWFETMSVYWNDGISTPRQKLFRAL